MRHRKHVIVLVALVVAASLMLSGCSLFLIKRNEQNINETSIVLPNSSSGEIDEPGKESSDVENLGPNYYSDTVESNPTTGFDWWEVYHSENLVFDGMGYESSIKDGEILDGAGGWNHIQFHVTGGEKAILILKYARSWEPGIPSSYRSYEVTIENGEIVNCEIEEWYCYADSINASSEFESGWLMLGLKPEYEFETYEKEGECGFTIKPEGERDSIRIFYAEDYEPDILAASGQIFVSNEHEYQISFDADGNLLYITGSTGINCMIDGAEWAKTRLIDIIEFMDNAYWEE